MSGVGSQDIRRQHVKDYLMVNRFALFRLGMLLPLSIGIYLLAEFTPFDQWASSFFYDVESQQFPFKRHWLFAGVIHDGGRKLIAAVVIVVVSLMLISFLRTKSITFNVWAYLLLSMVVTTTTVASIKQTSPVHCPYNLQIFGGDKQMVDPFGSSHPDQRDGRCWPAGHASGAFCLIAFYFVARRFNSAHSNRALLCVALIGFVFTFAQTARGAHFVSHSFWTMLIVWLENELLALFLLGRVHRGERTPAQAPLQKVSTSRSLT